MKNPELEKLIAPCGMNCRLCIAYRREKRSCPGCREVSDDKPKHCLSCIIARCDYFARTNSVFCTGCDRFPCLRMKRLDARYRKNYRTGLIDNLIRIQTMRIEKFLESENQKWTCLRCGDTLSIHRDFCLKCKATVMKQDKK